MTARMLEAVEGRPATTIAGLQASLGRARTRNVELALELRIQRHESRAFAERVLHTARELRRAVVLDRLDIVEHQANALGYHAARRIQQLGSVVL